VRLNNLNDPVLSVLNYKLEVHAGTGSNKRISADEYIRKY